MANIVAGRIALVTGGGSGIGRSTCQILAKQGASVIVADKNLSSAEETVKKLNGTNHLPIEIDVSNSTSVHNVFEKTIKKFTKPPCILVNSAGITRENFILKMSENDFDKVIDVNLKGTFLVTKTGVNLMVESKINNGSVINISSIIGKNGNMGQANYAASKAGVIAFTKTAAMEFGKLGIRVNAILPGIISTPMIDTIPDKVMKMVHQRISLGRIGQPDEIAELILFLASDKSSYISGASIEITGGLL